MATYTHFSASPFDIAWHYLPVFDILSATGSEMDIELIDGTVTRISGSGFSYDPETGEPVSGYRRRCA